MTLDKAGLFAAQEAFWNTEGGNEKGIEAAIAAYLERMGLSAFNDIATRRRAALAAVTAKK